MSKGHHAHRRKSYGRRQHDLRERTSRQRLDGSSLDLDDETTQADDGFVFVDDRHRGAQLTLGR